MGIVTVKNRPNVYASPAMKECDLRVEGMYSRLKMDKNLRELVSTFPEQLRVDLDSKH